MIFENKITIIAFCNRRNLLKPNKKFQFLAVAFSISNHKCINCGTIDEYVKRWDA